MTKVAVVTGGTRGIGYAISERLAKDGFKVAAVYGGNVEAANRCAETLGASVYKCDVADTDECASVIASIEADLGPTDILVNNAGITRDGAFHKMGAEQWHDVINTNLNSVFNMTRPVIGGMRARGFGRIVNVSSINGQKGQFGQTNYAAAKAGLLGFTRSLAMENAAKGITVNAIAPGYIGTDMLSALKPEVLEAITKQIPVGRLGTPEEIGHMVAFLVGEHSGFMTGMTLSANGGQYCAA